MDPALPLFAAIVVSLVVLQINQRLASPVLAIVSRWLRWLIFACGGAHIIQDFGWSERPYPMLAAALFLVWLLGETLYNWLAIHALSVSPLPLFPRFTANHSGEEWPTQKRFLKLRDWLRTHGFKQVQALKAEVGPGIYLRVSVYQDTDARTRLQITFLPQATGAMSVCFSLSTNTVSGRRYVTDNLYLPFGGFYPENWIVDRNPWRRSLPSLVACHRNRLAAAHELTTPWVTEPVEDINEQQRDLDRINIEMGFLTPHADREDYGKITQEGRYRVWKEYWLLSYFGKSVRYE